MAGPPPHGAVRSARRRLREKLMEDIKPDHVLRCTPDTVVWGFLAPDVAPVLHIRSGETVEVDTVNSVGVPSDDPESFFREQGIAIEAAVADMVAIIRSVPKGPGPHVLTGPIHVAGAEPGDVLEVEVLDVSPRAPYYGVSFTRPGVGSLPGLPDAPWLKLLRFDMARGVVPFDEVLEIPLAPFMGTMGVAPTTRVSSIPPGVFGGNIDLKDMRPGARLYLPVQVPGALFFVGDGHAAQGNGEVSLTGLETSMRGCFRFRVHKAAGIAWPTAETADHYLVLGLDEDLDAAAALAVSRAVDVICRIAGVDRLHAYSLASLVVDFELTQIVDGVKGVHGRIPKSLFAGRGASEFWGPCA